MNNIGNESGYSLFISDLHLCASRPAITQAFIQFLRNTASQAEQLYILGDLFEYWAGDDDLANADQADIIQAIKTLGDAGTQVFFMHGNRDFLISEQFAKATKIQLLPDPTEIKLYGKRGALSGLDLYFALSVPGTGGKIRFIGTGSPGIGQSAATNYYGTAQKIEYRVTPKVYVEASRSYGQIGGSTSSTNLQKPAETWGVSISYKERFQTWDQFWKHLIPSSSNKKK